MIERKRINRESAMLKAELKLINEGSHELQGEMMKILSVLTIVVVLALSMTVQAATLKSVTVDEVTQPNGQATSHFPARFLAEAHYGDGTVVNVSGLDGQTTWSFTSMTGTLQGNVFRGIFHPILTYSWDMAAVKACYEGKCGTCMIYVYPLLNP